ncbi:MAG: hypothetical protein HN778_03015 [Prolixibacteraceae bacterium]|jgi:hypothetical protein|nr:hypothetical protein [Prolixibacteraceae bacterium]MBT6007160.1 hypothetical protein [Prolixibacteraceae bacterium]MBT6764556.1 hypothetical protein [Prolixibacteraceae bacterium]MBT6996813.1 hypothetical protein [Prolixibacteraceae bacterium]MBT7393783.1 hypothetical protein [Prolixibacteraceae bacterium]
MAKGKKTGGRELGTPNKLTSELRKRISEFLTDNWEQIENDFIDLEPEKRIALFEKLLHYSLPRLQATQLEAIINEPKTIVYKNVSKQFPDN